MENFLSCVYEGAVCGINNLLDKCLLDITPFGQISMHDMLEEMGKEIVRQESKHPENRSRLWNLKDVSQVLKYNEVNKSIEGIKLQTTRIEDLLSLLSPGFEYMLNLRYIHFYIGHLSENEKLLAGRIDSISFPNELRYLCWENYPFKSLSPSFNLKNLVVLKLHLGHIEQLWNDGHQDLVNLRVIDLRKCKKLTKIPNLSGVINLQRLHCFLRKPSTILLLRGIPVVMTDEMRCDKSNSNQNSDSQEDANIEEAHHHSATERESSYIDGEEGDGGPKTFECIRQSMETQHKRTMVMIGKTQSSMMKSGGL
ncbi:hypothetical protein HRI_001755600 [Hibiscus trionum]|uniref:Disease resistance protein Roq1-like winged-helix domain-containing protein n=1 Tax=Hibiscus trionum TaxID=183268 RepID=A0A9W7HNY5_HIBTR|nr:hypothetical protein HRI_001755600 [Hibiscus trionum]